MEEVKESVASPDRRLRMRIEYDREAGALYIQIQEKHVTKTKEIEEGVLIDFDEKDKLIGIEILDATKRFTLSDIINLHVENLPVEVGR